MRLVFLSIFLTRALFSFGQMADCQHIIKGELHHSESHEPIPYANVYIQELQKGIATNARGEYQITGICKGEYTLVCSAIGFETKKIRIIINENQHIQDFQLEEDAIHLEEISVESEKISHENVQTQSATTLENTVLFQRQGQVLGEMLEGISGVSTLETGTSISKPVIQGLHSNRILILNNGIRQENQQWGIAHAPNIDPFVADKITVVKGAGVVQYGSEAIGGAVLVEPKDLFENNTFGGQVNLLGMSNGRGGVFSGTLEGKVKNNFAWRLQSSYKRLGDVESASYVLSNTGIEELNFSASLGYRKKTFGLETYFSRFSTTFGVLTSAHIGNTSDLIRSIERGEPFTINDFTYELQNPKQKIDHNLLKVKAFYEIQNLGKLNLQYAFQLNSRQEFDRKRRGGRSAKPSTFLELSTQTLDIDLEHSLGESWQGKIGFSGLFQENFNDVEATGRSRFIPDFDKYSVGVFLLERYIRDTWEVELGTRYEYQLLKIFTFDKDDNLIKPTHDFHNFSTTLGGIYYFNKNFNIRTNLAFAQRNPNINELYSDGLHHGSGMIERGDTTLQPETSLKWISTISFQNSKVSIELSPYFQHIRNYIYLNPKDLELTIRGAFPEFFYEQTDVNLYGADANLNYNFLKNLFLKSQISLISIEDTRFSQRIPWTPPTNYNIALSYEKPQLGKLKAVAISLQWSRFARQNNAPRPVENLEELAENPAENFDFMAAPVAYSLWDLSFGSLISIKENNFYWHLSIDNILNITYRNYMNRLRYYANDIGRNVTLRLKYEF